MTEMQRHTPHSETITMRKRVAYWKWEFASYYRWLRRRHENHARTRFVLLCRGRSGSHLLMSLLNQHPDIHMDHERLVLHQKKIRISFLRPYFEGLSARARSPVYGCKTHVQHVDRQGVNAVKFFERLHNDGWKLIYLYRENLVRQGISKAIVHQRNAVYDTNSDPLKGRQFRLEPARVVELIDRQVRDMKRDEQVLSDLPHLRIEYGADLLTPGLQRATVRKICDYVEIPGHELASDIRKTTPQDLREVISNYDDVVAAIAGSPYSRFLTHDDVQPDQRCIA